MATFKICIFEHQLRKDNKYPVSIRIYWKRKYAYIRTEYNVTDKQIDKKIFTVKDPFILNELNTRITRYEDLKVKQLGYNIELYTALELAEYFKKEGAPGTDSSIDFVEFAGLHCSRLIERGRKSTAATLKRTVNAMIDFCNGRGHIYITEITSRFLNNFELFLQKERVLKRKNQYGNTVTTKRPGLTKISVFDYMVAIRTLFNAAIAEYNDEDRGEIRIKHYPFRKYKLKRAPEPRKRALTIEQIKQISAVTDEELGLSRAIMARDVFMLSFYFVGMNLADMYEIESSALENGRISYYRKKTRERRQDGAYISIKVEPEAMPLVKKYKDKTGERVFCFANMYSDPNIFCANINKGLKKVAEVCDIKEKLTSYYARFSFATIARNDCGVSKDDINLALDHVDASLKMTDTYIKKDWSIIDKALRKVMDYLNMR